MKPVDYEEDEKVKGKHWVPLNEVTSGVETDVLELPGGCLVRVREEAHGDGEYHYGYRISLALCWVPLATLEHFRAES